MDNNKKDIKAGPVIFGKARRFLILFLIEAIVVILILFVF